MFVIHIEDLVSVGLISSDISVFYFRNLNNFALHHVSTDRDKFRLQFGVLLILLMGWLTTIVNPNISQWESLVRPYQHDLMVS